MITSLQNFISTKGKFVFVLLLLLVVVSFVLYLSQGSSVFDLFPDPNRETKQFYGYDWNDPDQRRYLGTSTRVASDFGAVVAPNAEVLQTAQYAYLQRLQSRMQAAFQANPEEVDREALQQMFSYMQAWPNFPNEMKAREIARSGNYGQDFLQSMIEARVVLEGQANAWAFMPLNLNHPTINTRFSEYLSGLAPGMEQEANRSRALSFVGSRHGISGQNVETILYDSFRNRQVENIYLDGGFALNDEAKLDIHIGRFAWDAEIAELWAEDLSFSQPAWVTITVNGMPEAGQSISLTYGAPKREFIFASGNREANGTKRYVTLGQKPDEFRRNLVASLNAENLGIISELKKPNTIVLKPQPGRLPSKYPKLTSNSKSLVVSDELLDDLKKFHESRKNESPFEVAPRTIATVVSFETNSYFREPQPPEESRLRSYYDRNQLDFVVENEESNTTDTNQTVVRSFEEVKGDILKRIVEQDTLDARKDADLDARNAALSFLDNLNGLSDLSSKYPTIAALRNSQEISSILEQTNASVSKISFSEQEMGSQAMMLGLERRSSEVKANRQPLEEVSALSLRKFFTRSIRKSRQGHTVFILDQKTKRAPGVFKDATFNHLYRGLAADLAGKHFSSQADAALSMLESGEDKKQVSSLLKRFETKAKDTQLARAGFDSRGRRIRSEIQKLETQIGELSEQDKNSTRQNPQIRKLETSLSAQRAKLDGLNEERAAILDLLESASSMDVDGKWKELKRNEDRVTFARLNAVYTMRSMDAGEEELSQRKTNIEAARGQEIRDSLVGELVSARLGDDR